MRKLAIILSILCLLVAGGYFAALYAANKMADAKLREALAKTRDKADVHYGDVSVSLWRQKLAIMDLRVQLKNGTHFTVGKVVVHDYDIKHPKRPQYATISVHDMIVPVDEANFHGETEAVKELGFEVVAADVFVTYLWDPANKGLVVDPLDVTVDHVGSFHLATALEHLEVGKLRALELDDLAVKRLHVTYNDVIFLQTAMRNTSRNEEELVRYVSEGIDEEIVKARQEGRDNAVTSLTELGKYVEDPGKLSVEVVLDEPMKVSEILAMRKVTEIIKLFTISITQQ
ncbi:MAG: hypothetical protein ACOCWR_02140 [Oceanidesulfovibrio sp.]